MRINLEYSALDDRRLVELHLTGDMAAFRQIVERHQGVICALIYSACGDLARSEDLAQEVFVAAWKQLPELREPEKLRGWLAGTARHLVSNSSRRLRRTPTAQAEKLSPETPAEANDPREQAITSEEAALMWKALESMPENYREPMVLYYREQRSVPAVAAALGISDETVRQRLVRGRAMLSERMAKLVEETLERSAPTPAFAGAVLLAIPAGVMPRVLETALGADSGTAAAKVAATAGGIGTAAAKGGMAVKALAVVGLLPAVFNGMVDFLKFRSQYEASDSVAHRRRIAIAHLSPNLAGAVFAITVGLMLWLTDTDKLMASYFTPRLWLGCTLAVFVLAFVALWWVGRWATRAALEEMRLGDRSMQLASVTVKKVFEYRSQQRWLGLPLLHVRVGSAAAGGTRTARGWIAVSDGVALGGILACGARLAVAPLSFGFCSVGLLGLGVVGAGVGVVAGLALGVFSYSGMIAIGWSAASGHTLAAAREFAVGHYAFAIHAKDAAATAFFQHSLFFPVAEGVWNLAQATLLFLWVPTLLLMGWYLWRAKARR